MIKRKIIISLAGLLPLALWLVVVGPRLFPQPTPGIGGSVIACVGTPGNTVGGYRQICQTTGGALYACNNSSGCTVAADWVAQGGSITGGSCTNQFFRSINSSGVPTCNTVANTDLANTGTTVNGSTCTLGSSCSANYVTGSVTSGHLATFSGTGTQIQDGGAPATVPSITQGTFASLPGTCTTGDIYFMTDSVYHNRCSATNTWSYFYQGAQLVTPPPTTSWTWDNQGSSSVVTTQGYLYLTVTKTSATAMRAYYRTAPATPYSLTILLGHDLSGIPSGGAGDVGLMMGFRDGGGKLVGIRVGETTSNGFSVFTDKWTTTTSFSANYLAYTGGVTAEYVARNPIWLRATDCGASSAGVCAGNSSNLVFWSSVDGQNWLQVDARARTDFMASGPNAVFVGAYTNGAAALLDVYSLTLQ